jgi:hypothetical protein
MPQVRKIGLHNATWPQQYVLSLYWASTVVTTVGIGDLMPQSKAEIAYIITAMLVSSCMYAFVFGHLADVIKLYNLKSMYSEAVLLQLRKYVAVHEVPDHVQAKLIRYFKMFEPSIDGAETPATMKKSLVGDLPPGCRTEVLTYLHQQALADNRFLHLFLAEPAFIHSIIGSVTESAALPQDVIVRSACHAPPRT